MKLKLSFIIFTLIIVLSTKGQKCEGYDEDLFFTLPDNFPDSVNCIDENGMRQGWWLIYSTKYNPMPKPDVLDSGTYVPDYCFGQYLNDRKIGKWEYIENVHLIYTSRIDSFQYFQDSTITWSSYAKSGWNVTKTVTYSDNGSFYFTNKYHDNLFEFKIHCDPHLEESRQCYLTYANALLKEFPINEFELTKEIMTSEYVREIKEIDLDRKAGNNGYTK